MIHFWYDYYLRDRHAGGRRLGRRLDWYLYRYLKRTLVRYYQQLDPKVLGIDPAQRVVVSLTSFPARIHLVEFSVKSLLHQSVKPCKVVLWLGAEKFPRKELELPESLLQLKAKGLEIVFCKDLKPHTKYFHAFTQYPNHLVVTVDDDLFYPRTLLDTLLKGYEAHPDCIIANRVRTIKVVDGALAPYRQWPINGLEHPGPSHRLLATGVGGVLYRPDLFNQRLFDEEGLRRLALSADDIWLKANELLNAVPVVSTHYYEKSFIEIPHSQQENLHSANVFSGDNDAQIRETFDYFGIQTQSFE